MKFWYLFHLNGIWLVSVWLVVFRYPHLSSNNYAILTSGVVSFLGISKQPRFSPHIALASAGSRTSMWATTSTAYTNGQCFEDMRRSTWSLVLSFLIINFDAEITWWNCNEKIVIHYGTRQYLIVRVMYVHTHTYIIHTRPLNLRIWDQTFRFVSHDSRIGKSGEILAIYGVYIVPLIHQQ